MKGPFEATRRGIALRLSKAEVEFLSQLPTALSQVGRVEDHPASQRLSVPIYLDDPAAQADYQRLMAPELEQARTADRSAFALAVEAAETGITLSIAEAEAFMRVLGEGRLALGASLGVEIEEDYQSLAREDAAALDYLAFLQGELVELLTKLTLEVENFRHR